LVGVLTISWQSETKPNHVSHRKVIFGARSSRASGANPEEKSALAFYLCIYFELNITVSVRTWQHFVELFETFFLPFEWIWMFPSFFENSGR
jgi:hypothetical protein